jgi:hypothetical protein
MKLWSTVSATTAPLILFNGWWTTVPDLHEEILALGHRHRVVVALPKLPENLSAAAKASTQ